MLEILKKLVAFNTIKDKENDLINDYLENHLQNIGFKTERINKCLIAKNDPNPKIGFLGHTDTVSYGSWDGDPFTIQEKDNKLIGLGVCDMKSGIAAILNSLSKIDLTKNKIALYFTDDEEISFKGIKTIQNENFPETVIIGEPTDNIPIYGTKGLLEYKIIFKGIKTHASTPEKGISAIYGACDFIKELRVYYEELQKDFNQDFAVPYTSMNVGLINGGEAINSVPEKCEITIDFRVIKDDHFKQIENKIKSMLKAYDAKMILVNKIKVKINNNDLAFLEKISSKKQTANYVTEGSFIDANIIILGPGPITAHEKNEYVTKESLELTEKLYIEIIKKYNEEEKK